MIQTYLIECTWQGELFQMMDSSQSDPLLSVHYMTGFWHPEMIYEEAFLFVSLCY